jgi:CotS family spore coat protein
MMNDAGVRLSCAAVWRIKMEEKIEEIIKQYPVQITGKKRIRGAILLEAKEGLFTLVQYKDSTRRLAFQEQVKHVLEEAGYPYVDAVVPNENGELLTRDSIGNRWLLKRWYTGRECNLRDEKDVCQATAHLAKLHKIMFYPKQEEDEMAGEFQDNNLDVLLERHMREMKRVYNYIRSKKKRNEMEICILNLFQKFYDQAGFAHMYISEINYDDLKKQCIEQRRVCHGSYNYHNIIFDEQHIVTTNFEKADIGIQIVDLYDFLRKIMEKNGWNTREGIHILDTYQKERPLMKQEAKLLYVLILFPEKFWKQINFYYNGKKSWMSVKNYDKLLKIESQEELRRNFLREAKGLLF